MHRGETAIILRTDSICLLNLLFSIRLYKLGFPNTSASPGPKISLCGIKTKTKTKNKAAVIIKVLLP